MESFLMSSLTMLVALAAVLAAAWLVLRLLRGRLPGLGRPGGAAGQAEAPLRVVRALQLGTRERVVLVEHGNQRWLLGVTAGGISTVAHWPAADSPAQPVLAVPASAMPPVTPGAV